MTMTLLVGGVRSGKSSTAEKLALKSGRSVIFLATGWAGDDEMAIRIARHRQGRPASWLTIEEPVELVAALEGQAGDRFIILDCLTMWLVNVLEYEDGDILQMAERVAERLLSFSGSAVVSNEVGAGIVPADADSRRYRDLLGTINTLFRGRADQAWLCVAGGLIPIKEGVK